MVTTLWQAFIAICVGWTLMCLVAFLIALVFSVPTRKPSPEPPTRPAEGRAVLPPMDIRPYRVIRSLDEAGDLEEDNLLYFDPSKNASYVARRLEIVKRLNEANN